MEGRLALVCLVWVGFTFGQTNQVNLMRHLKRLTTVYPSRNADNLNALNEVSTYIFEELAQYADTVYFQSYELNGSVYRNVVSRFGPNDKPLLVLGAHYDVCGEQPGADDNASGIAGLLEIARQLQGKQLNRQIELVAYTLEEPPHFRRKSMGSYVHAESLKNRNATVEGMVSIEMIGYFSDQLKSQHYPLPILALKYGRTGDFITVVKKMNGGSFSRRFATRFKKTDMVKTEIFSGPKALPGIDFSDHLNYWKFGFDAVMVTDTAFYRNKNYHESTDTIETLDIKRMAAVVDALVQSISN